MKRAHILPIFVLSLCGIGFATPNFSGRWVYDASASTLPSRGERIIVHAGNTFRISREWNSKIYFLEYTVDSLEHVYVNDRNDRLKYTAVLDGNTLRVRGTLYSRQAINHPVDDTYVLSQDGKTLTHFIVIMSRRGPVIEKEVYLKK